MARDYSTFFESKSITSTTAGASADVIFTVPNNHLAEVTFMVVSNASNLNTISIQVYHDDDGTYYNIVTSKSIPANDTYNVVQGDILMLHPGDKVVAYKVGGTFDVSVSGRLYYDPTR
jgi:hypothetical protein